MKLINNKIKSLHKGYDQAFAPKWSAVESSSLAGEPLERQTWLFKVLDSCLYWIIAWLLCSLFVSVVDHALTKSSFNLWSYLLPKVVIITVLTVACRFIKAGLALILGLVVYILAGVALWSQQLAIFRPLYIIVNSFTVPLIKPEDNNFMVIVACLICAITTLFIWLKPAPFLLLLAWIGLSFGLTPSWPEYYPYLALFAIASIFARQNSFRISWRKNLQLPPLALIATLLIITFAISQLLPVDFFQYPNLKEYLTNKVEKLDFTTENVSYFEFSIGDIGYYPSERRLGGPVNLKDDPVIAVQGPAQSFYLRGSVFDQFTGSSWQPTTMSPNYLFDNEDHTKDQKQIFAYTSEVDDKVKNIANQLFVPATIDIKIAQFPMQVIFNPGKLKSIQQPAANLDDANIESKIKASEEAYLSQRLENNAQKTTDDKTSSETTSRAKEHYYFNRFGQTYAAHPISASGYQLGVELAKLIPDQNKDALLQQVIKDAGWQNKIEPHPSSGTDYRTIIEQNDSQLADLVYPPTELNDAQKLTQLAKVRDYLKNNYTYSLDVPVLNAGEDFIAHFLQTKTGYCTYFATAMTVLARELGFTAQYVEGMVVPGVAESNLQTIYSRLLTPYNGHAWCEIWLPELGWIIEDATPATHLSELQNDDKELEQEEVEESKPTTIPTTPIPTTQIENQVSHAKPKQSSLSHWLLLAIILSLLILTATFVLWYRHRQKLLHKLHDADYLLEEFNRDQNATLYFVWQDIKQLMQIGNDTLDSSNTFHTQLEQIARKLETNIDQETIEASYRVLDNIIFANRMPELTDVIQLFYLYLLVEDQVHATTPKLYWFAKRFCRFELPR